MSAATEQQADASLRADAAPAADGIAEPEARVSPFTMVTGDPSAMVCEGDVCYIPDVSATS